MAWRGPGDKPLSDPMMISLLTHIWPQWVKHGDCSFGCIPGIDIPLNVLMAVGLQQKTLPWIIHVLYPGINVPLSMQIAARTHWKTLWWIIYMLYLWNWHVIKWADSCLYATETLRCILGIDIPLNILMAIYLQQKTLPWIIHVLHPGISVPLSMQIAAVHIEKHCGGSFTCCISEIDISLNVHKAVSMQPKHCNKYLWVLCMKLMFH